MTRELAAEKQTSELFRVDAASQPAASHSIPRGSAPTKPHGARSIPSSGDVEKPALGSDLLLGNNCHLLERIKNLHRVGLAERQADDGTWNQFDRAGLGRYAARTFVNHIGFRPR